METVKKTEISQKRLVNARRVASIIVNTKQEVARLRTRVEYQKLNIDALKAENGLLRDALLQALAVLHRPEIDGADLPGDLPIKDMADICTEVGLRLHPRLVPVDAAVLEKEQP